MKRSDDILELETLLLRPFTPEEVDAESRKLFERPLSGRGGVAMPQIRTQP